MKELISDIYIAYYFNLTLQNRMPYNTRSVTRKMSQSNKPKIETVVSNTSSTIKPDELVKCYYTRSMCPTEGLNVELNKDIFTKQLYSLLLKQEQATGRKTRIILGNCVFEYLRINKDMLNHNFKEIKNIARRKILSFYYDDKLYKLANEWHFWLFDKHIV